MNFASANKTIAKTIADLFKVVKANPNTFRLSVKVPDDINEEGVGQYALEASVVILLLNTAYSEVVVAATTVERRDAMPVADRGRSHEGYDDVYDGAEEAETTEEDLSTSLEKAMDRAAVVHSYAEHIAGIKGGGAEWMKGFDTFKYVAVDKADTVAVTQCGIQNSDVSKLIIEGRVIRENTRVNNRIETLNDWLDTQLKSQFASPAWKAKLAETSIQKLDMPNCGVSEACDYIGHIVNGTAFNRTNSRLAEAIERVANSKYISLTKAIDSELSGAVNKALKSALDSVRFSTLLQIDKLDVLSSNEWADHCLDLEIKQEEDDTKEAFREAIRAQNMYAREIRMEALGEANAQTANIMAGIKAARAAREAAKNPTVVVVSPVAPTISVVSPTGIASLTIKAPMRRISGIAGTKSVF
jgi:hypothetical protein